MNSQRPLRVAILNDYDVVVHGLRSMLEPYDEIEVVELAAQLPIDTPVDVTLYDTFSQAQVDAPEIDAVLDNDNTGAVVIYSWNMHPDLAAHALAKGCRGYLDKGMASEDLAQALVSIANGQTVISETRPDQDVSSQAPGSAPAWPGSGAGLTARESEVLALITQGLTNQDIAQRSYLSINSVKSYIRSAYRKIGVQRRSQAVRWGIENGMLPNVSRARIA